MNRHLSPFCTVALALLGCAPTRPTATNPPPAVASATTAIRAAIDAERRLEFTLPAERTVGVTPFEITSPDTLLQPLSLGLADLLITDLSRSHELTVVDRLRVDALLRELELGRAGLIDTNSSAKAGRLLGARQLVMGRVLAGPQGAMQLTGRIGNVVDGTVKRPATASASLDQILDAEKALAFALFELLGVTLTPAERTLVEQRPTGNLAALLAYSRGIRAEMLLDFGGASRAYQAALQSDPAFAGARARLETVSKAPPPPGDVGRVASIAVEGVNPATSPQTSSAADAAFRQRVSATITIILNLP